MVLIEGMPYPMPIVYLKVAGDKEVKSLPFSEALAMLTNVSFDYHASKDATREHGSPYYVIKGNTEQIKEKIYTVSKIDVMQKLQMEIYEDKVKIVDMAIQPEDERLVEEVKQLIGI